MALQTQSRLPPAMVGIRPATTTRADRIPTAAAFCASAVFGGCITRQTSGGSRFLARHFATSVERGDGTAVQANTMYVGISLLLSYGTCKRAPFVAAPASSALGPAGPPKFPRRYPPIETVPSIVVMGKPCLGAHGLAAAVVLGSAFAPLHQVPRVRSSGLGNSKRQAFDQARLSTHRRL